MSHPPSPAPETSILRLHGADRPGIVARVAGLLADDGANILDAQQFDDRMNDRFFMRVMFAAGRSDASSTRQAIAALMGELDFEWQLRRIARPRRVLIMVSKFDHCLADLLYRHRIGELTMDIAAIVSNHPREAIRGAAIGDLPFVHLPVTADTRGDQEGRLRDLISETQTELVVLARYMQVLTDELAADLAGKCINIHHSFLPGFKGAKPYHQAHARGVKMIGATAHYVTGNLDEGPIIHQDVEAVTHADTPTELVRKGRDIERRVLSEAVRLHLEDRVLINGGSTVVFRS